MRGLSVGRLVRRPVHRQHHGLRFRGDRARAAGLGRRAGALRDARPVRRGLGRGGDEPAAARHPTARHLLARGLRERRGRRGGDRRLDQCRPASAGDGARVRHQVRPARRGEDLQEDALHRRPQAGRKVRGVRSLQCRRHSHRHQGAARCGPPARRRADGDRQDAGREPQGREVPGEPGRRLSREELPHADRRRGRAEGQPRTRRRHREGGGHAPIWSSPVRRAASIPRKPRSTPS